MKLVVCRLLPYNQSMNPDDQPTQPIPATPAQRPIIPAASPGPPIDPMFYPKTPLVEPTSNNGQALSIVATVLAILALGLTVFILATRNNNQSTDSQDPRVSAIDQRVTKAEESIAGIPGGVSQGALDAVSSRVKKRALAEDLTATQDSLKGLRGEVQALEKDRDKNTSSDSDVLKRLDLIESRLSDLENQPQAGQ